MHSYIAYAVCKIHIRTPKLTYLYCSPFLTGAQDSHLQRVTIPEAAHIQLRRGPPDYEQG